MHDNENYYIFVAMKKSNKYNNSNVSIYNGDALTLYKDWKTPTMIMSDGPYGINGFGFKGDLLNADRLSEWYEPHIKEWTRLSTPQTTLWFWCTEQGWAAVHPTLLKYGWEFKACHVWDKGLGHVAGNTNTKTITHLPIVTEVCVQYVKKPLFIVDGQEMTMKEWLRYEWQRTGLPFSKTNVACGVVDAATRKYFTKCHLWYMPPSDAFGKISEYANTYGKKEGRPYFSIDGIHPLTKEDWENYKPKFHCPLGVTNVWSIPQLRNKERVKRNKSKAMHLNQKPLQIIKRLIEMCTDELDVVWEPFGGLCTTAIASLELGRECFSAEINGDVCNEAVVRIKSFQKTFKF